MKLKIAILEIAMLLGICGSALLLPRSFPLTWFIAISFGVFLAANVLLFRAQKVDHAKTASGYRLGPRAYLGFALMILYWVVVFLRR